MNTKAKATVATIGLGALVLSGGTLALWQDQADLKAATISTGHLKVTAGKQYVYDNSEFKLAATHSEEPGAGSREMIRSGEGDPDLIPDLDDYKASPGDTIRVVQALTVDIEGHNLLARLGITDKTGANLLVTDRVPGDYPSGDGDEFSISNAWLVTADSPADAAVLAQSTPWDQVTDEFEYRFTEQDNGAQLYVVYDIFFDVHDQVDAGAAESDGGEPVAPLPEDDQAAMEVSVVVSGLDVTLTQIRHADETVEP